jgi:hypothetical protein
VWVATGQLICIYMTAVEYTVDGVTIHIAFIYTAHALSSEPTDSPQAVGYGV